MCRSVIAWPIARAGNGYPPRCLSILEIRGPAGRSLKQMSGWGRLRRSGPGDLAPRVGFRRFGSAEPTSETRELEAVASDRNRQHNRWNRACPLGVEQRWRAPRRVSIVKYYPSVVVLGGIRALAHVEPADPLRQDQDGRERRGRHHDGGALSGDPLQAHQQRELALHGGRERQRMPQNSPCMA